MLDSQIWTKVLTNAVIVVDSSFGVQQVEMTLISGEGSFKGSATLGTYPSTPIPLIINAPITIKGQLGISELTIDCHGGGVINIVGMRN